MVGSTIDSILLTDLAAGVGNRYNYGVSEMARGCLCPRGDVSLINDLFIQVLNKGRGAKIHPFIATETSCLT